VVLAVGLASLGCETRSAARIQGMSSSFALVDFDTLDVRILPLDSQGGPMWDRFAEASFRLSDLDAFPDSFPFFFNVVSGEEIGAAVVEIDALRLDERLASGGALVRFYEGVLGWYPLHLLAPHDLATCESEDSGDDEDQVYVGVLLNENLCSSEEEIHYMSISGGARFGVRFLRLTPAEHDIALARIECVDSGIACVDILPDTERLFTLDPVPIHAGLHLRTPPIVGTPRCCLWTSLVESAGPVPLEFDLLVYEDEEPSCAENLPTPTAPIRVAAGEPVDLPDLDFCPGSVVELPLEVDGNALYLRATLDPLDASVGDYRASLFCGDGSRVARNGSSYLDALDLTLTLPSRPPREDVHRCFLRIVSWRTEALPLSLRLQAEASGGCLDDGLEPNDTADEAISVPPSSYEDRPPSYYEFDHLGLCPFSGTDIDDPGPWHDWFAFTIPSPLNPSWWPWYMWIRADFRDADDENDYQLSIYRLEAGGPIDDSPRWEFLSAIDSDGVTKRLCAEDLPSGDYAVRVSCVSADCRPFYDFDIWNHNTPCL
jgi:hypothetical protein